MLVALRGISMGRKTMLIQVYEPERKYFIEKHDFFVNESNKRIISQFADIEGDTDKFVDDWLESSQQYFDPENDDSGSFYERANEKALEHYFLLSDMKKNAILAMTASIFHHWDKTFRAWMVKELRLTTNKESEEEIWRASLSQLSDFFKLHGWDMAAEPAMKKIMVLHDVVNAYKHGEGRSFKRLAKSHTEYLDEYLNEMNSEEPGRFKARYENLCVSESQFAEFADAIRNFWYSIPAELYWREDEE